MSKTKKSLILGSICLSILVGACLFLGFVCNNVGLRLYENEFFIYTVGYDSNEISIFGLTDKGKEQEYLVIPENIDGKIVKSLGCYTGYEVTKIQEKYGDASYSQFQSEKLKKVYIVSEIEIVEGWTLGELFENAPSFETLIVITNSDIADCSGLRTKHKATNKSQIANVSYYYNYQNAPNDGYYWIDDYAYGSKIEYIPDEPVRQGYSFGGWYKEVECINLWNFEVDKLPKEKRNEQGEVVYQETILYAKWIENIGK